MQILIIGSGGREHALAKACHKSDLVKQVYVAPGNDGMRDCAKTVNINNIDEMLEFAKQNKIDLTIVGPEEYLSKGIVDSFRTNNLLIFGPTKKASQLEASKAYAKLLMEKFNVPTASYVVFEDYKSAEEYASKQSYPLVIKYDGLAAGKGVVIVNSFEEAKTVLKDMLDLQKFGKDRVVIEEYLEGIEFTLMALVNDDNISIMDVSQDYKQVFDNDEGPNTGGMGVCSPVDVITDSDKTYALNNIINPIVKGMKSEGNPFCGFLYAGLMKTRNGIKVIEFNVRFGDPEAEVLLERLESDLVESILKIMNGETTTLNWSSDYAIGVVMASKGYPSSYQKGFKIENLDDVNCQLLHMGTTYKNGYYTNGGRVLIAISKAESFKKAYDVVYENIKRIKCDNLFYRTDIGKNSDNK